MNISKKKSAPQTGVKKKAPSPKPKTAKVAAGAASANTAGNQPISDVPSKKAVVISIAINVLSNILTDLLKPDSGWGAALHKVGELLGNLPFASYVALSKENTSKKVTKKDYDLWINSILISMADFQRHSSELREIRDEFEISYEDIAALASKRIFASAGIDNGLHYFQLREMINSYFLYQYLQASVPLDVAKKVGAKMRI